MNTQSWFLPYAKPNAINSILNDEQYFSESMSPLFNNIKHPYNPQYRHKDIAGEVNHNMLEGQPSHFTKNKTIKKGFEIDPYEISSNFVASPKNGNLIENDHQIKTPTTQIVPWDTIMELNKNNDKYFNEQNFQEVLNHPFYNQMKPFLEQPFKHI